MKRKALLMAGIAATGLLVANQWPDLIRYLKIKQMSFGHGHPENVPAAGTHRYPEPA